MNQNDTTIIPGIETLTVAGAKYVRKVTHPPTINDGNNEYYGTPDRSAPNVVLIECKGETNVPLVYNVGSQTVNPGRVLFLSGSGMRTSAYVFFWVNNTWIQPQSSTSPALTQIAPPATLNAGYNFNNWSTDIAAFRTTYKSETYYLNATGFNNQGTVTCAKFKPNILVGTSSIFQSTANDVEMMSFHEATINSLGVNSTYSKIYLNHLSRLSSKQKEEEEGYEVLTNKPRKSPTSQARVQAARLAASQYNFNYQFLKVGSGIGTIETVPTTIMSSLSNVLPETMSEVLVSSPKGNTRPATEGAFVVHQQVDDILTWQTNTQPYGNVAEGAAVPGMTICYLAYYSPTIDNYLYAPLYADSLNGPKVTFPYCGDTPWNNLDWSYTLFDGLTVPSASSTALTGGPYITIKSFVGCEAQPYAHSSLLPFQRSLPLPDRNAIDMAIGIHHARPDSLPASANDLASVATVALQFLPTAVSWLKDIFGKKKQQQAAVQKAKDWIAPPKNKKTNTTTSTPQKANHSNIDELAKRISKLTAQVQQNSKARPSWARNVRTVGKKQGKRGVANTGLKGGTTLPTYQNSEINYPRKRRNDQRRG